ncbi:MAG: hypothetical protein E7588_01885 [Ruminococcaceae bacterium]|nr:hypothetical protein [Oscillospiraceae bacterium]
MKRQFRKSIISVIFLLVVLTASAFAVDQVGNITHAPQMASDPGLGIIADADVPVFKAGESAVLEIPVKTSSIYTAFDVVAHLTHNEAEVPFELESMSPYSKTIQVYYQIPAKILYNIFVPINTVPGVYPINIDVSYSDMFGGNYNKSFTFYIKIENPNFAASNLEYLTVSDFVIPEKAEKDNNFVAEIELKNTSGMHINKATVEIITPSGLNVVNDTSIKGGSFAQDALSKFKFNIRVSDKAESGAQPINFKITVFGKDNSTAIQEFTFSSVVNVSDDNYYYNPILEITDIVLPESVKPGEQFDVSVTYRNEGDCELRYIRTEIISDISSETFVNKTATSQLIQRLSSGESVTKVYTFSVSEKAKGDFYDLQFNAKAQYDISAHETGEISATQYNGFYVMRDADSAIPYTISDIVIDNNVTPDKEFILKFNVSVNAYAEGLKIEAVLPDGIINTTPCIFWYDAAANGSIYANEIKLKCADTTSDGYKNIKISVSAQDKSEVSQYIGTYVSGTSDSKPYYSISDIKLPSEIDVSDSKEFNLEFTLTCLNADDKNVGVNVDLPAGIVNRTISRFYIGDMKAGEAVKKQVTLFATDAATDGFANIEISVSSAGTEKIGQYTGLSIKNKTTDKDDIPVVIIDEYDYGSEYVLGGSTFPLKLKFLNTSLSGSVKDLKITLASDEDGVFTPAASSNTYFVQGLAPGQSADWNLDIQTKSDIQPQSYGLIINISYKNENGIEKTSIETLTIPVRQEMRFNISDLPVFNDISMNEDAILTLNCANLGKSTVYNVLIKIQGNFYSTEHEIFAGNIEAGKGYSNTVYLTPTMEGMQEGTVTFQYEDADGVVTTEEKAISFNAYSMDMNAGMFPMYPDDELPEGELPAEQSEGLPWWIWYVVGALGVVLVVVCVIVVVKIRKNAKMRELEDED